MQRLWQWYLGRGLWAKIALLAGYSFLLLAAGSGIRAVATDSSGGGVSKAYRTGVQEATEYINARNYGPTGGAQQFCQAVSQSGVVGIFQQTAEYQKDYEAGCEGVWSDWQG